ncbi:MAG: bifunctional glutamate N-acetyltransferase/amino-acid acetyltransferase ArgJ [Verrucomicrobiota bacterium]|nr:bifunctional glutamate N-acetyltransferase/amino-acid acetyltransferase ArgJ [Verrucomicrobiota bacterium]
MTSSITVQLLTDSNGIGDCPGFQTAGVACDIRETGDLELLDLALFTPLAPCSAAGVFTQNDVRAAPVKVCQNTLTVNANNIGGCVINSGNANAVTGEQGYLDALKMDALARQYTNIQAPFLVCSTGRIGRALPMHNVKMGILSAAKVLGDSKETSFNCADAILTSDTHRKVATARFVYEGTTITVAGMAKGAGMIEPNMATMLAYVVTDLQADSDYLQSLIKNVCDKTFNCISVDGDMSTNDTVLIFSNGQSGLCVNESPELVKSFEEAVFKVCNTMAEKIVGDGEKVSTLIELIVEGCENKSDAEKVARTVGNSLLVKTSWYGDDPNWGRLADAAGYARVGLDEKCFDIHYDNCPVLIAGKSKEENSEKWKSIVAKNRFRITLNLNKGKGSFRLLPSDLSEAYVAFNKSE